MIGIVQALGSRRSHLFSPSLEFEYLALAKKQMWLFLRRAYEIFLITLQIISEILLDEIYAKF